MRIAQHILRAQEAVSRCQSLARFTEDPPRICRTFLSPPMHACHRQIEEWMQPLGMSVTVDAAGNLRGLYPAGEGAGYAGGILSAAIDGIKVAEAVALDMVKR